MEDLEIFIPEEDKSLPEILLPMIAVCGGLTLGGCHVPTKATRSLPSSAGQGRENIM